MPTRTQERAFRVYYAAMPDDELRNAAVNRGSFLPLAQRLLAEELERRHLTTGPSSAPADPAEARGMLRVLRNGFRH
jgi:hypothetical protein